MKFLNSQTNLKGRMANDVDIRPAAGGQTQVVSFTIATHDSSWKNDQREWEEQTTWHDVVAMGKVAESISRQFDSGRVGKGALVEITGQYRNNNYTDKNGVDRYKMECRINAFNVLIPSNQNS
jgi:single-strand DNA-binding protein